MLYKQYGSTGKKISAISFGGMRFADPNDIDASAQSDMRIIKKQLVVIMLLTLPAWGFADTVYTISGKTYSGKVSADNGKVTIQTDQDEVILDESDVIHIARDETAETQNNHLKPLKIDAPLLNSLSETSTQPSLAISTRQLDTSQFTMPQSFVFLYMRNLSAGGIVDSSAIDSRKQLDYWRTQTQSMKRRAGLNWIMPRDFIRRREKYIQLAQEGEDLAKKGKIRSLSAFRLTRRDNQNASAQRRYLRQANEKFQQAGRVWADPQIQHFLTALADMHAENYQKAVTLLDRCVNTAPRVAGFYQARAIANTQQRQYEKALADWIEVLKLKPDCLDAVKRLRQVLADFPSDKIDSDLYRKGRKLSVQYPTIPRTRANTTTGPMDTQWLMPGSKEWKSTSTSIPIGPYDRFYYRQAVGVPVSPSALLVDRRAVHDAVEIYVRINDTTLARAQITGRLSLEIAPDTAEVAILTVEGYTFEAPLGQSAQPDDSQYTLLTVNCYEHMGSDMASVEGKLSQLKTIPGQSGGPVIDGEFNLAGFVGGKIDPMHQTAGPDRFWNVSEFERILKSAQRTSTRDNYPTNYRTIDYDAPESKTSAKKFMVYATHTERFD